MTQFLKPVLVLSAAAAVLAAGCSRETGSPDTGGGAAFDKGKYVLAAEPAGAKGVIEVRKASKDGDEVVIVGRIGGSEKPFVEGRASFTIIDLVYQPCLEDGCGNPWCEIDSKELKQATTLVKFVDEQGRTLPHDAEKALGLKALQTVVVRGQAKRGGRDNLTVLATGVHVKQ
jgi:hypothetical protein